MASRRRRHPIITVMVLGIPIGVYLIKYSIDSIANQGTLGILALCLIPVVAIPAGIAILFESFSISYGVVKRDFIPALTFTCLILLAVFLPLPPLPPSDAEQHFYEHHAQYQHLVDLARQGKFPDHPLFNDHIEKQQPLVIFFDPMDQSYTYVVYAENRSDLKGTDACDYDGGIHSQIGDTWWTCFREWN